MKPFLSVVSRYVFLLALIFLDNCRKASSPIDIQNIQKVETGNIPDWLMKKIRGEGRIVSLPKNEKSQAVFLDQKENERPAFFWRSQLQRGTGLLSSVCDATDDAFLDNAFTIGDFLVYFYGSQNGFKVEATYTLSTAFAVQSANPSNPSQLTRGRLRIKNRINGTILYNYSSLPLTFKSLGPDPSNSNKTLYELKFSTPNINDPNINLLDVYFDARPIVYTDCSEVIITPVDWQGVPWGIFAQDVCSRVDQIYINPAGSSQSGWVYISGCDAISPSTYPGGVAKPNEHEVWYQNPPSTMWNRIDFQSTGCYVGKDISLIDTRLVQVGPGNKIFRFKNVHHTTSLCWPNYSVDCWGPFQYISMNIP